MKEILTVALVAICIVVAGVIVHADSKPTNTSNKYHSATI